MAAQLVRQSPPSPPSLLLPLNVAALQLETQPIPTAENLAHIDALLDAECQQLGVIRWDEGQPAAASGPAAASAGGGSRSSGSGAMVEQHLHILILPEVRQLAQTAADRHSCKRQKRIKGLTHSSVCGRCSNRPYVQSTPNPCSPLRSAGTR